MSIDRDALLAVVRANVNRLQDGRVISDAEFVDRILALVRPVGGSSGGGPVSPEDAFRRVLAARLPAGPGWTAWIDGTVQELAAAAGVTLAPEEAELARIALNRWAYDDEGRRTDLRALAARLGVS